MSGVKNSIFSDTGRVALGMPNVRRSSSFSLYKLETNLSTFVFLHNASQGSQHGWRLFKGQLLKIYSHFIAVKPSNGPVHQYRRTNSLVLLHAIRLLCFSFRRAQWDGGMELQKNTPHQLIHHSRLTTADDTASEMHQLGIAGVKSAALFLYTQRMRETAGSNGFLTNVAQPLIFLLSRQHQAGNFFFFF